jgi:hypothetical protein
MPSLDTAAVSHLDSGDPTKPIFFLYLDVDGDPIRGCTTGYPVQMPEHDDPDLSEHIFYPTAQIVTVGDVSFKEGGSETLTVEASGLLLPDNDLLNAIGDRSKWQGRTARLWVLLRDQANEHQGVVANYYTGWMSSVRIIPRRDSQVIRLEIEGYLASLNQASNRTYLNQADYDAADTSAGATIGSANGRSNGAGGWGGGGAREDGGSRSPNYVVADYL